MKNLLLPIAVLFCFTTFAQDNFTYSPEKPKAGDEIRFSYTPSGDLAGVMQIPEAFAMIFTNKGPEIKDLVLQREYGKLVGRIKTDTSMRTLALGFTNENKFDNNANNGYIIQLSGDDGKIKPLSYTDVANIYSSYGEWKLGMKRDYARAMDFYQSMFKEYPDTKNDNIVNYLFASYADNKEKGSAEVQKEIENTLMAGLKEEKDYAKLISLYNVLRLRQQSAFIQKLKDEKFLKGDKKPGVNDYYEKFMAEQDIKRKEQILTDVMQASKSADENENYKSFISFLQRNIAEYYVRHKNWDDFKRIASQIKEKPALASLYNNTAWKMQEDSTNLTYAEQLSSFATSYAKNEVAKPTGIKPKMSTAKQWERQRKDDYAMYADTYAMIMYRLGNYKKGLPYAKDAAQAMNEFKNPDYNATYALLAERALAPKTYRPQLEQFVKDGKSNTEVKNVLKRLYAKQNGGDAGFDDYISALEKEAYLKMLADLKKDMINEATPQFTLKDLSGNTVNMADLKGKTIVVDFWATWCGPCIASMPGMKKMVEKYKNDPNVKFVFIDTWQNEENETDLVKKFIADKGYGDFHVLMDLDDKVVSSFKVEGIPTKFVVGKDGNIKFKEVGFDGEDNLVKKLPAMIELAN